MNGRVIAAAAIGGPQFRTLHLEPVHSGKITDRAFPDAMRRLGRMPVEMGRAGPVGRPLSRDSRARWKVYDRRLETDAAIGRGEARDR